MDENVQFEILKTLQEIKGEIAQLRAEVAKANGSKTGAALEQALAGFDMTPAHPQTDTMEKFDMTPGEQPIEQSQGFDMTPGMSRGTH